MPKRKDRVVLDTNIWISYLISDRFSGLDTLFNSNKIELLFCDELLQEFIEVVKRPKISKIIEETELIALIRTISEKAIFIDLYSSTKACRDEKDNFLLSLCKDGKATHLISGDKDLLSLKEFGSTKIQTYTAYISGK